MKSSITCKMVTFNCKSVKRSAQCIRELCKTTDIIALQETWLLPEELSFLDTLSDDFSSTGVSAVDTSAGILRGRPYGGVALLWRRSMFQNVSVIQCDNPRICGIKIMIQGKAFLVISVYMPTDAVVNLADFTDVLSSVSAIIDSYSENCVYVLGDFNAHPSELFYNELTQFCLEQEWTCKDIEMLGLMSGTHTFLSEAHGSKRWLDHCIVTQAAMDSVRNIYVLYDMLWSDHFPLIIECNMNILVQKTHPVNIALNNIFWGKRGPEQIDTYQRECHDRLRLIDFPHGLLDCCDRACSNSGHKIVITKLYNDIIQALRDSAVVGRQGNNRGTKKKVSGWNKHVADAHKEARQKFLLWTWHGKPTAGRVYLEMCEARKIFKARLKWCQNHQEQIKMDILASHHSKNVFRLLEEHV